MFNLQDAIKNIATDLAIVEPVPGCWAEWVTYLLAQLQVKAESIGQQEEFEAMLEELEQTVQARLKSGRW